MTLLEQTVAVWARKFEHGDDYQREDVAQLVDAALERVADKDYALSRVADYFAQLKRKEQELTPELERELEQRGEVRQRGARVRELCSEAQELIRNYDPSSPEAVEGPDRVLELLDGLADAAGALVDAQERAASLRREAEARRKKALLERFDRDALRGDDR
jgi:hypothetical protein